MDRRDPSFAVVVGASGGIGSALVEHLEQGTRSMVIGLSRRSDPPLDLMNEDSVAHAASVVASRGEPDLVIVATGVLHAQGIEPEKSWRALDAAAIARVFAVNAIGPAVVMKHFLPLLPRDRPSVFAAISAKVGSIGDNRLGGWYAYRASKAALNQLVRTAAIELARRAPQAVCVAVHPGTVDTALSTPFQKTGLAVQDPHAAAAAILDTLARLGPRDSGGFFDRRGERIPW